MTLEHHIEDIRAGFKTGRYENEAAISQSVVARLLRALGWNTDDSWTVYPEYPLEGRRVDFALCDPMRKPKALIEVKRQGQTNGAEKQLFEYAFIKGIQLVILTDGQEWGFFLPAEEGDYDERRVYKIDITERETDECVRRLNRYLKYEAVISGDAIEVAREDYRNASRRRQIEAVLPKAWAQLISDEDSTLLGLLADRVESLCGYRPDAGTVASFLKASAVSAPHLPATPIQTSERRVPAPATISPRANQLQTAYGFVLYGERYAARDAKDVLVKVFEELTRHDPAFPERFASLPKHGRIRPYLARTPEELFPTRPEFAHDPQKRQQLNCGWWIDTNVSNETKLNIFDLARQAANPKYGWDLHVELGE